MEIFFTLENRDLDNQEVCQSVEILRRELGARGLRPSPTGVAAHVCVEIGGPSFALGQVALMAFGVQTTVALEEVVDVVLQRIHDQKIASDRSLQSPSPGTVSWHYLLEK